MLFFVCCFHYNWWHDRRERKGAEVPTKSFDGEMDDAFGDAPDDEGNEVETNPIVFDSEGLVFDCDGLQTIETEEQLRRFWRDKTGVENADPDDPEVERYYRAEEEMVEEFMCSRELLARLKSLSGMSEE